MTAGRVGVTRLPWRSRESEETRGACGRSSPADTRVRFSAHLGSATAVPDTSPDSLAPLIADVAEANQNLQDLGADVQAQQEASTRRSSTSKRRATTPPPRSATSRPARRPSPTPTGTSPTRSSKFDTFAAADLCQRAVGLLPDRRLARGLISTATAGQTLAVGSQQVMTNLQRARTEQVNRESTARLAKQKADQATVDAQTSMDTAVTSLTNAQHTFADQQGQINQLAAQRDEAKARLQAARQAAAPAAPALRPPHPAHLPGRRRLPRHARIPRTGTAAPLRRTAPRPSAISVSGTRRCR